MVFFWFFSIVMQIIYKFRWDSKKEMEKKNKNKNKRERNKG